MARKLFRGKVGAAQTQDKKNSESPATVNQQDPVKEKEIDLEAPFSEITTPIKAENSLSAATVSYVLPPVSKAEKDEIIESARVHFDSPAYTERLIKSLETVLYDEDFFRVDYRSLSDPEKTLSRLNYAIRLNGLHPMTRLLLISLILTFRDKPDKMKLNLNRTLKFTTAQNAYIHMLILRYLGLLNVQSLGKQGTEIEFLF